MEAASNQPSALEDFLSPSVRRMDSQERNLNDTGRAVQALVTQVSELTQQLQLLRAPTAPPIPPAPSEAPSQPEPRLPIPESYSGEPNYCRAFLTRCDMHFSLQPRTFANERAKVAFVLTLLTGRAALWGTAVWENQDPCCASFQSLSAEMRRVFDRAVAGREAARKLAELRQHGGSVSDYSTEFRTLAVECHWNEEAQWDMFLHGLSDRVQKEIYALDLPTSLNGLIELALRVDARLTRIGEAELTQFHIVVPAKRAVQWRGRGQPLLRSRAHAGRASSAFPGGEGEAEVPGPLSLLRGNRAPCLHLPGKRPGPVVRMRLLSGGISSEKTSSSSTLLLVRLRWAAQTHNCQALLDSGAEGNFMDSTLAHRLHIPLRPLPHHIMVHALNGQKLPVISHVTEDITLITSGNHSETISFHILDSPLAPIVLGHPWLLLHNPKVDWSSNNILTWCQGCHESCLVSACPSVSMSVLQEEAVDLSNVPAEYLHLKEVFSKSRAASLPPHRPYNCAIELLSGKSPPKGKLYSLSVPEREAMEKYISDSLASRFIHPSSSPAGAGFFFVGKKDGSLRPCIDYRGLNDITVKNTYPLPLMSSAFERLQGASIFTKLDLRNAYHLARIRKGDEWKTL